MTENITDLKNGSYLVGKYMVTNYASYKVEICYDVKSKGDGHDNDWHIQNPLLYYIPNFGLQLCLLIFLSRFLAFILKPLRQPRFIAEVIAGILLGPSLNIKILGFIFNFESTLLLETIAHLGLTYYMFMVGLEMDLSAVRHIGKKALSIAIGGIIIPIGVGIGLYFLFPLRKMNNEALRPLGAAYWGITLTITSFPDLARILSDVKLLHTNLGRMALNTAVISDVTVWILLTAAIILSDLRKIPETLPTTVGFLLICWFLLRPGIAKMVTMIKKNGGSFGEMHIYVVLAGVAIFGLGTEACGAHSMIGGFILGLIIPRGDFAIMIMERIDEFITGILLPIFILSSGFRTNFRVLVEARLVMVALVVILASVAKIISTVVISLYLGMSAHDGFALGSLLNTKGVLALIVLNEGRTLEALDNVSMLVMIFSIMLMTALVEPISSLTSKATKNYRNYKQRTIQRSNLDTELRILTCIHSIRNVSGILNLLDFSNPTRKSPISVFAIHLVELTGRASAMLLVHDPCKTSTGNNQTREKVESDQIISALQYYQTENDAVIVHPLTVVSPYATMHEDIFHLAEDRRVAMIVIPFHKQQSGNGELQGENHSLRLVTQNLLIKPPCSVGILVDRGLESAILTSESSSHGNPDLRFCMLFIGGPDDHEALSYAWKMAGTPGVNLTVVRFLPDKDVDIDVTPQDDEKNEQGVLDAMMEEESRKEFDDEFINEFRFKTMFNQSIVFHEKQVNNIDELVQCISTMYDEFDLYVVGRGEGVKSRLTVGISEWSENPELGPLGDTLITSEFTSHASVLVVQQHASDEVRSTFGQKKWVSPILNPEYAAYVNNKKEDSIE